MDIRLMGDWLIHCLGFVCLTGQFSWLVDWWLVGYLVVWLDSC